MSLRLIFMGTPEFATPSLKALIEAKYEIVAVYTRPPAKGGRRGLELIESPVHKVAKDFGIPVFTPKSFKKKETMEEFAKLNADAAIVIAYGLLLPKTILDAPKFGCFNLHASILPRWRGAAPIQRAIMAGDEETGIGIMRMEAGLDTGDVALEDRIKITQSMNGGQLHDILMQKGAKLLIDALGRLKNASLNFLKQSEEGMVYAAKITKDECKIDFCCNAQKAHNKIRALSPFPGAFFEITEKSGNTRRIKVFSAEIVEKTTENLNIACGVTLDDNLTICFADKALRILELQPSGKGRMKAADFLKGNPIPANTQLS